MKILLSGRYSSEAGLGGGSGSYFRILNRAFLKSGHETVLTDEPAKFNDIKFDLTVTSHEKLDQVKGWNNFKAHVCHGPYKGPEEPRPGADAYVSVSEETQASLKVKGYDSAVIRQPIEIFPFDESACHTGGILFIRNNNTRCLEWWKNLPKIKRFFKKGDIWGINEITASDPSRPINDQILESRMIISLGRGALEAMALSRCVIIADNRGNIGLKGDGYLDRALAERSMRCNYNGKSFGFRASKEWMAGEIKKFNPEDARGLYEHVSMRHESLMIAGQFLKLAGGLKPALQPEE
jgi:hypothetical protein